MTHLYKLDLSYTNITDYSLYTISNYLNSLIELNINGCKYISNKGINKILNKLNQLKVLNINHTNIVTKGKEDNFIITLKHHHILTHLYINNHVRITNFKLLSSNLIYLNLSNVNIKQLYLSN